MDRELIELRERVSALEKMLAAMQQESGRPNSNRSVHGRWFSAAALVLACMAVIIGPRVASVAAQGGPSKVVAPFLVVDGAGNHLFSVTTKGAAPGGGRAVRVFGNASSDPVVTIAATDDGQTGFMTLTEKGQTLVDVVATPNGYGAIQLKGAKTYPSLELMGMGWLTARNDTGKEVVHAGTDGKNNGELALRNAVEHDKLHLFVAPDGSGLIQLSKAQDQFSVHMGTKGNGKGDVCAYGTTGQICLSLLGAKNFVTY